MNAPDPTQLPPLPAGARLRDAFARDLSGLRAELAEAGFGAGLAVVLGSGLSAVVDGLQVDARRSFSELPGFHAPTVEAHPGELLQCRLEGLPLLVLQGRLHAYEGLAMAEVLLPIATLWALGARGVLLTNAAGGLRPGWSAGEFMLIDELFDLHLVDPLRALLATETAGASGRFIASPEQLDPDLGRAIVAEARSRAIGLHRGCYASVWGPHYETAAEIGMLRHLGADAVGMSTGPECSLLHRLGVRVAAISCITNIAVETGGQSVTHAEVVEVGKQRQAQMSRLVLGSIEALAAEANA